jgi:hypothetical protein
MDTTKNAYLDKVIDKLFGETIIDHEQEEIILPHHSYPLLYHTLPVGLLLPARYGPIFFKHCRDIYGITEDEIQYVWGKYIKIIKDEIENKPLFALIDGKRLNESKQIDYLDKVVEYLVYDSKDDKLPFDNSYISFNTYIKNIYGITDEEVDYVYFKYRYLVGWDEVRRYNEYLPESLNESREDNYLDKVVNQLVDETTVNNDHRRIYFNFLPRTPVLHDLGPSIHTIPFPPPPNLLLPMNHSYFIKHCKKIYGLTENEIIYVWDKYKSIIINKMRTKNNINESKEEKQEEYLNWALKTTIKHLRSEAVLEPYIDDYIEKIITGEYNNTAPASLLQMWRDWGLNWGEQALLWEQIKDEWGYAKKLKRWYDKNRL